MRRVWILLECQYYREEPWIESVHLTKKQAEAQSRKQGFKWNREQGIFLNDDMQHYRRIERHEVSE